LTELTLGGDRHARIYRWISEANEPKGGQTDNPYLRLEDLNQHYWEKLRPMSDLASWEMGERQKAISNPGFQEWIRTQYEGRASQC
jgi:hypothetical protein